MAEQPLASEMYFVRAFFLPFFFPTVSMGIWMQTDPIGVSVL